MAEVRGLDREGDDFYQDTEVTWNAGRTGGKFDIDDHQVGLLDYDRLYTLVDDDEAEHTIRLKNANLSESEPCSINFEIAAEPE